MPTVTTTEAVFSSHPIPFDEAELRRLLRARLRVDERLAEAEKGLAAMGAMLPPGLLSHVRAEQQKTAAQAEATVDAEVARIAQAPRSSVTLTLRGSTLVTRSVGTNPPVDRLDLFASAAQAANAFKAACADQHKRGWLVHAQGSQTIEVDPLPGTVTGLRVEVPAQNERDLARAVIDQLLERGDVRGALGRYLLDHPEADPNAVASDVIDRLLTPPLLALWPRHLSLRWRHGLVVGLSVRGRRGTDLYHGERHATHDVGELASALVADPLVANIEQLELGLPAEDDSGEWGRALETLSHSPVSGSLRHLTLDALGDHAYQISWLKPGDFTPVDWAAFGALESIHLTGGATTWGRKGLSFERLTRFVRESGGLGHDEWVALEHAVWPSLEHLELWSGSSEYGASVTDEDVRRWVATLAPRAPRLRSLGLVNSERGLAFLQALATSPLPASLGRIDASKGNLSDEDLGALEDLAQSRLGQAQLDFRQNLFSAPAVKALQARYPRALFDPQRVPDDDSRYVAVGE